MRLTRQIQLQEVIKNDQKKKKKKKKKNVETTRASSFCNVKMLIIPYLMWDRCFMLLTSHCMLWKINDFILCRIIFLDF